MGHYTSWTYSTYRKTGRPWRESSASPSKRPALPRSSTGSFCLMTTEVFSRFLYKMGNKCPRRIVTYFI